MTRLVSAPEGAYEFCVVGAGPVGLPLALEAAEAGLRVLLLDAGDERSGRSDTPASERSEPELVDAARHAPMAQIARRGLGGTSWMWGGRCVQFEPIDFEVRDFVPESGWPIGVADVRPWQQRAAEYLDCGSATFRSEDPDWPGLEDVAMSQLERWARRPKLGPRLGERALSHPLIDVLFGATVTDIAIGNGAVEHLVVRYGGRVIDVRASEYALAMGGLETTRLLFAIQRRHPDLFGGADGPLGRYYMGHATGSVANIVLKDPADVAALDFRRDEHDSYVRRRFTFDESSQREHELLNTSFYLDNPPFYETGHRNATLSLVFLALAVPPVGRRILAEGIRLRHIGPTPRRYGAHVRNVLRRPWRAAGDTLDILRRRYLSAVRKPGFVLRNAGGTYALHYHAEQIPNPDSRVRPSGGDGPDGLPELTIDFRYTEQDIDSVLRCHEQLDQRLRASGRARIEYLDPQDQRAAAVWEQATDGFHHIGTTRMHPDPALGVVDADSRVHGVGGLSIASSSVFPTAGEANPTFLAVCLALRLAHDVAERVRSTRARSEVVEATP
ncbi:GMC family oxidoreductase [Microbacteriaceae bacterium VKM Ac-2854]|nr:GMC family oxidoreductase [Microbacteriaceae bacterium VKM Ac-2854]